MHDQKFACTCQLCAVNHCCSVCRIKYYNNCLFYNVQRDFIAQTGDPSGTGRGGESLNGCVPPASHCQEVADSSPLAFFTRLTFTTSGEQHNIAGDIYSNVFAWGSRCMYCICHKDGVLIAGTQQVHPGSNILTCARNGLLCACLQAVVWVSSAIF